MGKHLNAAAESNQTAETSANRPSHDFEQQCLRVLRCTAQALANSPGGLRFQAGTRPWLDALSQCRAEMSLSTPAGA
jgi:hypothetical protein